MASQARSIADLRIPELKHRFTNKVKHRFLARTNEVKQNQEMLDSKELARRIREAMDEAKPKVRAVTVAAECHVTAQAVHGWRKTGLIAKWYLAPLAKLTGRPITYFLVDDLNATVVSEDTKLELITVYAASLSAEQKDELLKQLRAAPKDTPGAEPAPAGDIEPVENIKIPSVETRKSSSQRTYRDEQPATKTKPGRRYLK